MKTYIANDELIALLKKNKFVETSTLNDTIKGVKKFKRGASSLKEIIIENEVIDVYEAGILQDSKASVTEEELRLLVLFFQLKSLDLSEITQELPFKFATALERFVNLQHELMVLTSLEVRMNRIRKIDRIIDVYNDIEL